jgi:hypothetical protein
MNGVLHSLFSFEPADNQKRRGRAITREVAGLLDSVIWHVWTQNTKQRSLIKKSSYIVVTNESFLPKLLGVQMYTHVSILRPPLSDNQSW